MTDNNSLHVVFSSSNGEGERVGVTSLCLGRSTTSTKFDRIGTKTDLYFLTSLQTIERIREHLFNVKENRSQRSRSFNPSLTKDPSHVWIVKLILPFLEVGGDTRDIRTLINRVPFKRKNLFH